MSLYICRQCATTARRANTSLLPSISPSPLLSPPSRVSIFFTFRTLTGSATRKSQSALSSTSPPPVHQPKNNYRSRSRSSESEPITLSSFTSEKKPIRHHSPSRPSHTTRSSKPSTSQNPKNIHAYQKRIDDLARSGKADQLYEEFWRISATESIQVQRHIWSMDSEALESIYRAMNSRKRPARLDPGSLDLAPLEIPKNTTSSTTTSLSTPDRRSSFTLQHLDQSHRTRLLQMHQYFESVLGLPIGYYARIALLTAFSTAGDMITTTALFDSWRHQPVTAGDTTRSRMRVGKEMYSAVIRGLVGNHFQDAHYRPFRAARDARTSVRNNGTTQVHAALELFYDLLRRGGTPTFETYHSLIVGMSVFKNDMEAAELLLDHMLVTKKRPYVQVLHVMIREYTRRRDFRAAERIFGMLKEYRIRPKAITCNMMLKAVFDMSPLEAEDVMGRPKRHQDRALTGDPVTAFKRAKVQKLLAYMRHNKVDFDQVTYSTLIYGFGHFPRGEGYPDMKRTMEELSQSRIEPNLAVLSSLLFAHLQQGKLNRAEVFLDQMVGLSRQEQQDYSMSKSDYANEFQQKPSPFRVLFQRKPHHEQQQQLERAVLGKGPFHAIMLALIEHGDISGMERVLDKMMAAAEDNHKYLLTLTPVEVKRRPVVDLKADEHTAKILLLGYLTARDFAKAELVQAQINARPEWAHLHQASPLVLQDAAIKPVVLLTDQDSVLGELEGELDDNIEIDVTTLSAKLRGLMKSAPLP